VLSRSSQIGRCRQVVGQFWLTIQLDGYAVLLDDFLVAPPLISKTGLFETHPTGIDAVLHGDNAHEGNFFRLAAQQPDALNELRRTATLLLGSEDCAKLFEIYELSDDLDRQELAWRLHQFPEDVRFYLHSDELQRAWPDSAFYHLSAPSPFTTSAWPKESFHTLDLLYVSTLRRVVMTKRLIGRCSEISTNFSLPRAWQRICVSVRKCGTLGSISFGVRRLGKVALMGQR